MQNVQDLVDRVPPEAWPLIETMFKITIALAIIWLALAIVAWWRRRAYNLTVASTAGRSEKAQPDFLRVDEKAREAAIERGEAHEKFLDDRERDRERAAKDPLSLGQRLAGLATLMMSIFTLSTVIFGAVNNVRSMGKELQSIGTFERLQQIIVDNWLGATIAVFVIGWHVSKYFLDRKWTKA